MCIRYNWSIYAVHFFSICIHISYSTQNAICLLTKFCYSKVVTQDSLLHFKSTACGYRDVYFGNPRLLRYLVYCSCCSFKQNFCKTATEIILT